jgi:superfamily II DNA/RNA helicase
VQSSFKDVGASEEMVKALKGIGIERPSFIQAAAYQVLMSGARHIVLADHAGVGPIASLGGLLHLSVFWSFRH